MSQGVVQPVEMWFIHVVVEGERQNGMMKMLRDVSNAFDTKLARTGIL